METLIDHTYIPPYTINILNLEHPDTYQCRMLFYDCGHSRMILSLTRPKSSFADHSNSYLLLDGVSHYEGPLAWTGANFIKGDIVEYFDIHDAFHPPSYSQAVSTESSEIPEHERLTFPSPLVKVKAAGGLIRIIVMGRMWLSDDLPEDYKNWIEIQHKSW